MGHRRYWKTPLPETRQDFSGDALSSGIDDSTMWKSQSFPGHILHSSLSLPLVKDARLFCRKYLLATGPLWREHSSDLGVAQLCRCCDADVGSIYKGDAHPQGVLEQIWYPRGQAKPSGSGNGLP